MVEHMVMEGDTSSPPKYSKSSSNRTSFFNAYLFCSSICAIAGLIIGAISLHKASEFKAFQFSQSITDLERTFNSTVYAITSNGIGPACEDAPIELITGQTSIPSQCVTVTASDMMYVTRLAVNCVAIVYESANCTGTQAELGDFTPPSCIVAAGLGMLGGDGGDFYESFKVVCS
ncbi:uncharacterized protein N7518_005423 [Penicillium psychrosexuale]|uniref:uncharacterized protein n=1 Tax=Penicillium psychrosexuale TaxID=1002107 RepID=UPI002544FEA8|nr:uncharacterized protein N7518_005423 [Penicillium psychrosexuale]KAJ5796883.1 hypothetical protein N7518_005423 [Penicillium psychrosexuale]